MNRADRVGAGLPRRTAHSPESVRASGHRLDWDIKPSPFKIYADLPPIPLPRDLPALGTDACAALSSRAAGAAPLDLDRLAALLFFSAGITRTKEYPGRRRGSSSAPRPPPARSTRPRSTSWRARSPDSGRACITSLPATSPCARCAPGTSAPPSRWPRPTRGSPPRRHGGRVRHLLAQYLEVPGARLPAPLLGRGHPARQPPRRGDGRSACPRGSSPASSSARSTACSASTPRRKARSCWSRWARRPRPRPSPPSSSSSPTA